MAKGSGPIRAAGVVLIRRGPNGPLVCVLHRPRQNDWSLPKGKVDPGETLVEAARRETIEETGCDVVLGIPLTRQRYTVESRQKTVDYWVGWERPGGPGFLPNREIDQLRWLSPAPAIEMLSYPRDGQLVRDALSAAVTTPLIVLRHAEAVRRADFRGGADAERPLASAGQQQAASLAGVLDAFGIVRVHSSDSVRCLDTVRPFAHAQHARITHEPLLSESGFAADAPNALARVEQILRDGEPTVVCTHRPVLTDVIRLVADALGVEKAPDPALPPGAGLIFHRDAKGCAAVERFTT